MRIGVTGALGYIGSRLCVELMKKGHQVVGIDNKFSNKVPSIYSLDIINTDINSNQTILALRKCDVVIHLASVSGVDACNENKDRAINTNILGTYNIAKICADAKIPLIFASSASAYHPEYNSYAKMKQVGSDIIQLYSEGFGFPAMVFMIGNVYGTHKIATVPIKKNTAINKFKGQAESGNNITVFGDGKQSRYFVHIDDVVNSFINAADFLKKESGFHKVNLVGDKQTKIINIAKHFSDKHSVEIEHVDNPRNEIKTYGKLSNADLKKKLKIHPKDLDLENEK